MFAYHFLMSPTVYHCLIHSGILVSYKDSIYCWTGTNNSQHKRLSYSIESFVLCCNVQFPSSYEWSSQQIIIRSVPLESFWTIMVLSRQLGTFKSWRQWSSGRKARALEKCLSFRRGIPSWMAIDFYNFFIQSELVFVPVFPVVLNALKSEVYISEFPVLLNVA
jgi:hypothetical protein